MTLLCRIRTGGGSGRPSSRPSEGPIGWSVARPDSSGARQYADRHSLGRARQRAGRPLPHRSVSGSSQQISHAAASGGLAKTRCSCTREVICTVRRLSPKRSGTGPQIALLSRSSQRPECRRETDALPKCNLPMIVFVVQSRNFGQHRNHRGTSVNMKAPLRKYFSLFLWVAVAWLSANGPVWAQVSPQFEVYGVESAPKAALVGFSSIGSWRSPKEYWDLNPQCYYPTLPAREGKAQRWDELNDLMLKQLGMVIKSKTQSAKSQIGADGSPPKWWRDLLAAYTTLVSYTPFDEWENYLHVIDPQYKIADARVYCFTSGDRGGWVIDRTFSDLMPPGSGLVSLRKHVIFFTMGTNTKEQMAANKAYLPYHAPLQSIIWQYQFYGNKNGFCPALGVAPQGLDYTDNYIFNDIDGRSPVRALRPHNGNSFVFSTISLGAVRGIRAACLYPEKRLFGRDQGFYNPMKDFFNDIQYAHVTFAGHSRGGIGEGLAAFVSVHKAGQTIRSLRVVGLATPAASNLWQKSGKLLPNGREFSRIIIQNQSSDLAGLGADQVPRFGSEGGAPLVQQWKTGLGTGLWNVNYGQQKVRYLFDWATDIANERDSPEPTDTMIERSAGETWYLIKAAMFTDLNFASLALPHWAGVYAAGIIGQSCWNGKIQRENCDRATYYKFLSALNSRQEKSLLKIRFNATQGWLPTSWFGRKVLNPEYAGDNQIVRRAFLNTEFKNRDDSPGSLFDPEGDLWTFFYMSEAALAATQSSSTTVLPSGFLPGGTYYSDGADLATYFKFVHIRHASKFCKDHLANTNCNRWLQ